MQKIINLVFPVPDNNHRPHLTRHSGLTTILMVALITNTAFNLFVSSTPKILGYATNIYQQELIDLTNQEREKAGLEVLTHNSTLDEAARLKAIDMFENDYWAHVSPTGIDPWYWFRIVGYDYLSAGENLARDFDTSTGVVSAWMASPSHRENIVYENFSEIGMAVVNGNLGGEETTLVVQLFGTPQPTPIVFEPIETEPTQDTINPPQPTPPSLPTPTLTPTNTPTPSPQPTQAIPTNTATPEMTQTTDRTQNHDRSNQTLIGPSSNRFQSDSPNPTTLGENLLKDLQDLSPNRLFTAVLVTAIIFLFISDSIVVWRKGLPRENAHRMIHAAILLLILAGLLYDAHGAIL